MAKMKPWYEFQEILKSYFQLLGCDAQTNVTTQGVRTNHNIDVLVKSKHLGHDLTWIIEAKKWKHRISKLHVLGLRQIVDEIGADKGFIISEKGFQKGALEASKNTNISLLTFEELQKYSSKIIQNEILEKYLERINLLLCRYYSHDKNVRIKYNLRQDSGGYDPKFNVYFILVALVRSVKAGLSNAYPIIFETYLDIKYGEESAENYFELINWLNINFLVVEEKLFMTEIEMQNNGDYNPKLYYFTPDKNIHMQMMKVIR